MLESYIENKIIEKIGNINILHRDDKVVSNFGKQWKNYRDVQIDSKNNFKLSYNFLQELCHFDLSIIKNKNILEIGCGSGRFTEYLSKYGKSCTSIDLSDAIFHNICKNNKNVKLLKADFLKLKLKKKFDVVFCRGVLQHTKFPTKSILKLFEYINHDGVVIFDFYKKPKIGFLHPKYLIWRPLIKNFIRYETYEKFLINNISFLLYVKRKIDIIFFKKRFFSDSIIPIWDYYDELGLTREQYLNLSLLDTMDGIYANYDKPYSFNKIKNILIKNNKLILKSNKKNYFISKNNYS